MVQIKYFCDICKKEITKEKLKTIRLPVLHIGWKDSEYIDRDIEVCEHCRDLCTPVVVYSNDKYKLRDYYKNGYTDNQ